MKQSVSLIGNLVKFLVVLSLFILSGCASSGEFKGQSTGVGVNLVKDNFKIIKVAAMGESNGFRLFGLIPFSSPTYSEAKAELYKSVGEDLTGRSIALANQTEDRSFMYFILFSLTKMTLTADVIEYQADKK